jgi:HK97 family phage prohead protease
MVLRATATLRDRGSEDNIREFVISNEVEDRHETIIKLSGWDLDQYQRNPVVMYAHAANRIPDPDLVIGRGKTWFEGDKLIGSVEFEPGNPLAEKVMKKIDSGFLRATSVGFFPVEWRWGDKEKGEDPAKFYFTRQVLTEFSIVPVGSNPDALKRDLDEFMEKIEIESTVDDIKSTVSWKRSNDDVNEIINKIQDNERQVGLLKARFYKLKFLGL